MPSWRVRPAPPILSFEVAAARQAPECSACCPQISLCEGALIVPPIKWQVTPLPVAPPAVPVIAERGGTQLRTPKPVILVDTREQNPFSFERFSNWFAGIEKQPLEIGDYSVAGLENRCVVERKHLNDLVRSFLVRRPEFVKRLRRMSAFPDRLLVITAAISQIKSRYEHSPANPNQITQSLMATLAGMRVPFLCVDTHELGEEIVESYLYQVHLYHWLETNGYGRRLTDDDL